MKKKYLGIDYGDKRIGLALAEESSIALPFKILDNSNNLIDEIKNIVKQESINMVVIGLPHSFSGKPNERLTITENFVDLLKKNLAIEIATVDEQLTSKLYEKMGVKKDIDKHSATAILETYLTQLNV